MKRRTQGVERARTVAAVLLLAALVFAVRRLWL
jgi:hypothetical protein